MTLPAVLMDLEERIRLSKKELIVRSRDGLVIIHAMTTRLACHGNFGNAIMKEIVREDAHERPATKLLIIATEIAKHKDSGQPVSFLSK